MSDPDNQNDQTIYWPLLSQTGGQETVNDFGDTYESIPKDIQVSLEYGKYYRWGYHSGDDFGQVDENGANESYGSPVVAIADGEVVFAGEYKIEEGRQVVIIKHEIYDPEKGENVTVYSRSMHLDDPLDVKVGDTVVAGQQIGKLGDYSFNGPGDDHLHFDIMKESESFHVYGDLNKPLIPELIMKHWAGENKNKLGEYLDPMEFLKRVGAVTISEPVPNPNDIVSVAPHTPALGDNIAPGDQSDVIIDKQADNPPVVESPEPEVTKEKEKLQVLASVGVVKKEETALDLFEDYLQFCGEKASDILGSVASFFEDVITPSSPAPTSEIAPQSPQQNRR